MFSTNHWAYWHGSPSIRAYFKQQLADFKVTERLGYEPSGEGEHLYLWVEKQQLNTAYVAEQLAKFSALPLRNVTYAGRKDKFAQTFQWFALHLPGKQVIDWKAFDLPGARIHKAIRHHKKLRVGQLKGNQFEIRLRQLSAFDGLEERLTQIAQQGVPNYFGPQRFGDSRHHGQGGNLALAELMLAGESIRNRNKRNLAISAMRSWLFNEVVHQRITQDCFNRPLPGDVFCLRGSNSFFCQGQPDEAILSRLAERDIAISAPLWGQGELATQGQALTFEQEVAEQHTALCHQLEQLGLKQERRPTRLFADNLCWKIDGADLTIQFFLPSGCFATSVLRELVILEST